MGSVVAKLFGKPADSLPPFVDLMQGRPLVRNSARPGYLGPAFAPFRPDISDKFPRELEEGMKVELQRGAARPSLQLSLVDGLNPERLADRQSLLNHFDDLRRLACPIPLVDVFFAGAATEHAAQTIRHACTVQQQPAYENSDSGFVACHLGSL